MVAVDESMNPGRGGGRSGGRPDPADRAQLERSPVRWSRVAGLFRPF
ncbi:MAG: ABC-type multidrug transport system, ATPase and permease component, partial [Modestobacter sp.]|nr:ABC-type multidrug transport system, ATPase and permease component [Modestobacter sp.]